MPAPVLTSGASVAVAEQQQQQVQYVVQEPAAAEQQQQVFVQQSAVEQQQFTYSAPQVQHVQGGQMLQVQQPQVLQMPAPVMTSGVQGTYQTMAMQGIGARHSCPPEIFQKLAAGGALTQEEVAQITGQIQVAPAEAAPGASAAVSAATGAAGAVGGAMNS